MSRAKILRTLFWAWIASIPVALAVTIGVEVYKHRWMLNRWPFLAKQPQMWDFWYDTTIRLGEGSSLQTADCLAFLAWIICGGLLAAMLITLFYQRVIVKE